MKTVLIDANIIFNVWRKEINPASGENYSSASKKILKEIIRGKISGIILSTTAMELLHGVRVEAEISGAMAPAFAIKQAESMIAATGLKTAVPDSLVMTVAYDILARHYVDPFDAILVAAAINEKADAIISRDRKLKKKVSKLIPVLTPEEFLEG